MDPSLTQVVQIAWRPDQQVSAAEGACLSVLGRPADELVGLPLHEVLGISLKRAAELDKKARNGGATEFLVSTLRDPARLRVVLDSQGGTARAGILDLDAILHGAPPVQISRLSSSLSHELRNPLSSVKMAVQTVAKSAALNERDQRRMRIANREIRTMERMLSLLSEYGRDLPPVLEPMALRGIVAEAAALVELELGEREIKVEVAEQPEGLRARVDMARLRPVLAQLLMNAASGLAPGTPLQIVATWSSDPEPVPMLCVPDNSAAVPPEERATLFEPFGSRLARGAGLSLAALSRTMVQLGGRASVEERSGGGVEFRLLFPT